jgi:hypothetical protein
VCGLYMTLDQAVFINQIMQSALFGFPLDELPDR